LFAEMRGNRINDTLIRCDAPPQIFPPDRPVRLSVLGQTNIPARTTSHFSDTFDHRLAQDRLIDGALHIANGHLRKFRFKYAPRSSAPRR